jgi:gliding motility-associated-like protein
MCDTATIYINVIPVAETNVFVPNAFSPNGDLIYDLWVIDGIENYPNNVLKIYNRWGNVVYEKKSYDNSWDGKSNAGILVFGDDLPDGTYYYVLDLGEGGKAKAGFVVIKRK